MRRVQSRFDIVFCTYPATVTLFFFRRLVSDDINTATHIHTTRNISYIVYDTHTRNACLRFTIRVFRDTVHTRRCLQIGFVPTFVRTSWPYHNRPRASRTMIDSALADGIGTRCIQTNTDTDRIHYETRTIVINIDVYDIMTFV